MYEICKIMNASKFKRNAETVVIVPQEKMIKFLGEYRQPMATTTITIKKKH